MHVLHVCACTTADYRLAMCITAWARNPSAARYRIAALSALTAEIASLMFGAQQLSLISTSCIVDTQVTLNWGQCI